MDIKGDRRTPHSSNKDHPHYKMLLKPFQLRPHHKCQKSLKSIKEFDIMQHDDTFYNYSKPKYFTYDWKELRKKFKKFNLSKKFNKQINNVRKVGNS
jgi:hypothetical protein